MIFGAPKTYELPLSGPCLKLLIGAVFILQFNFGFLMNGAGGGVELITSYIYLFWLVLDVLGCVGKLLIIAFKGMFETANVSSTHPAIQFRVFDE